MKFPQTCFRLSIRKEKGTTEPAQNEKHLKEPAQILPLTPSFNLPGHGQLRGTTLCKEALSLHGDRGATPLRQLHKARLGQIGSVVAAQAKCT